MANAEEKRIGDFGEKIGGAKKDQWKERNMVLADIEEMDPREYGKYVKKDMIWNKPDYVKVVEGGMEKLAAYCVKHIRDKLPAKPVSGSKAHAEIYLTLIEIYRDVLMSLKTEEDISEIRERLKAEADKRGYHYIRAKNYISVLRATSFSNYELGRMRSEMDIQGFPESISRAAKGLAVRKGKRRGEEKETYFVVKDSYILSPDFDTYDDALAFAKETLVPAIEEKLKPKGSSAKEKVERPQLANIKRIGPDYRTGKDVLGEDLLELFKFRGGEFGNWNTQGDRVACLKYSHDAFKDLAKAVRSTDGFMSLGAEGTELKRLGIAFGARGGGRACAHYEPEKAVINLTKLKGAGSLAHEWGHALDDFIGVRENLLGYASKKAHSSKYSLLRRKRTQDMSDEDFRVLSAFIDVMEEIHTRDMTEEERLERHREYVKGIEKNRQDYKKAMAFEIDKFAGVDLLTVEEKVEMQKLADSVKESDFDDAKVQAYLNKYEEFTDASVHENQFSKYEAARTLLAEADKWIKEESEKPKEAILRKMDFRVDTEYYKSAKLLDAGRKKEYYQSPVELFARAFEAFIEDKLSEKGVVSDYLVHSTKSTYGGRNPYPLGEERDRINEKIEKLLIAVVEKYDSLQPEMEKYASQQESVDESKNADISSKEKKLRFQLTEFKTLCKEKGLKVDMGETEKSDGDYIIKYYEGYVESVRVPIYFEKENAATADTKESKGEKIHVWGDALDYSELAEIVAGVDKEGQEKKAAQAKKAKTVKKADKPKTKDQLLSEKNGRIGEAKALRDVARDHGLRLLIDDIRGLVYLYHGTSAAKSVRINKTGFEPGTVFAHAQTKTGYAGEGPKALAKKHGKSGKVLELRAEPSAVSFNKETGEFVAADGLVKGEKWWVAGSGITKENLKPSERKETVKSKRGIKDTRELRAVLVANIKDNEKADRSEDLAYMVSKAQAFGLVVSLERLQDGKGLGCSGVWTYEMPNIVEIDSAVSVKKQVEGIIESMATSAIAKRQGMGQNVSSVVTEGVAYMLCKAYGLDVRSYCKDERFEKMVVAGDKATASYIKSTVAVYKDLLKIRG